MQLVEFKGPMVDVKRRPVLRLAIKAETLWRRERFQWLDPSKGQACRRRSASVDRLLGVVGLFALCLTLTGCWGDSSEPPVPPAILKSVLAYFVARKSLRFAKVKVDRHQGFFVRRRAEALGHAKPSWITEDGQTTLKARIDAEFEAVRTYLQTKLGSRESPSKFMRSADTAPHMDLGDFASILTTSPSAAASRRQQEYANLRRYWVTTIVWRAAGIFDELWVPSADGRSATLNQPAMNELVDRRLHTCERMHHQVSSATALAPGARLTGAGATGPWTDGFRVRPFEYPRIRISLAPTIPSAIGLANIDDWDTKEEELKHSWRWESRRLRRLVWNGGSFLMAEPSAPHWHVASGSDRYSIVLEPKGVTPTSVLELLFTPSTDWWGRSWMFCDHVVSALHVDSLRLGLLRRTEGNAAFDDIVTGHSPGFVALAAFVGWRGADIMMCGRSSDKWFDNVDVPEADLQIGDQLILWNSFLYPFIATAEWRLENSIVMDLDSDPNQGSISRESLQLQGHGIGQKSYARYLEEIADYLAEGLADVRQALLLRYQKDSTLTSFVYSPTNATILRWDPYEADAFTSTISGAQGKPATTVNGAWWVRIPIAKDWADVDVAIAAIPKTAKDDPSPGARYRHPDGGGSTVTDAVFFPLFELGIGWAAYFQMRRADTITHVQTRLREVHADRTLAPGLFPRGVQGAPIAVVRARMRP